MPTNKIYWEYHNPPKIVKDSRGVENEIKKELRCDNPNVKDVFLYGYMHPETGVMKCHLCIKMKPDDNRRCEFDVTNNPEDFSQGEEWLNSLNISKPLYAE